MDDWTEVKREMLTCEAQSVEVILPCDWAVRHAVHERSQDGASSSFVDAEDVWAWSGGRRGVVRVGLCEWCRWCRRDVHVSHEVSRREDIEISNAAPCSRTITITVFYS